jgi:hypothetical protein
MRLVTRVIAATAASTEAAIGWVLMYSQTDAKAGILIDARFEAGHGHELGVVDDDGAGNSDRRPVLFWLHGEGSHLGFSLDRVGVGRHGA